MSLHTFVIDGRKRLQISQSKAEPGKVLVQVLDSARDVLVSCTMDAETAGVVSQALELEAVAAENAAQCCTTPRPDCMGMLVPSIGDNCKAMRGAFGCTCEASRHVGRFKPPCSCGEGRLSFFRSGGPVMSALPVVDVAQVGA